MSAINKFQTEHQFAMYIREIGGRAYLVGGAVRDKLLDMPVKDRDYVITGVNPFQTSVGRGFPVYIVEIEGEPCEVAVARREKKIGDGHTGFECDTNSVTIEDDLSRRDLTMNAMAIDILTGEFIDPFGGREDINMGMIHNVSDAFLEDPLRVYRAARFAATTGFQIARHTLETMKSMVSSLSELPVERIWKEYEKALASDDPHIFFQVLHSIGALPPEIAALDVPDGHDGTALAHTLRVMSFGSTPMERFGLLVHDLGKGLTPKEGHPSHFGHAELGVDAVHSLCDRLRIPNKYREFGVICCKYHMKIKKSSEMRPGKFMDLVDTLGESFTDVLDVSAKDSACRDGGDISEVSTWKKEVQRLHDCAFVACKIATGKSLIDAGYSPGPNLGELLKQKRIREFIRLSRK